MIPRVLLSFALSVSFLPTVTGQQPQPRQTPDPQKTTSAQQQSPPEVEPQDVVRITSNLVQVDAVVTKDGKQVTDLRAEDFELFEDGKPQSITHFSYISNVASVPSNIAATASPKDRSGPPVVPAAAHPHDLRRTIALVVDDLGMSFQSMADVRRQARKFIDEKLQPNDLVAIVRTGGEVGALQQFTTDKRMLYNALDHLHWYPCSRTGLYVFAPAGSQTTSSEAPCGGSRNISDTLRSLKFIVQGMRDLPGRKSLVLFSDHLPIETQEPGTTNSQVQSQNNTSAIDTGDADFDSDTTSYLPQLQKVAELAIRASVVIYAVDTRGLQYTGVTAADRIVATNARGITTQVNSIMSSRSMAMTVGREGSDLIARQTGGFLIRNSNDFGLPKVMEDQQGYYLIGFRPNEETFNRNFHHIKIKVKGRGLTVRTREGFYGMRDEDARPKDLTAGDQLKKALMSPFGANDIALRLTPIFTNFADLGSLLRSLVYVNARDLTFVDAPDGAHKATFDLAIVLFGDNGGIRDQQNRLVTLTLRDEVYQSAVRNGIVYTMDMPLKRAGAFQFRIALRDQSSSRIGSAGQFVQIPNLQSGRLALSGVALFKDATDQNKPASASTAAPSAPQKKESDEISSGPALRQFSPGSRILFAYSIYNAQIDPSTHLPRLTAQTRIFRDGKAVFTGNAIPIQTSAQSDFKRIPNITGMQLGLEFLPGDYVLQVLVTDHLAKEKEQIVSQWIDFEVVK